MASASASRWPPAAPSSSAAHRPGGGICSATNWNAIGAVAELVGALGVVASLIYVATQVCTANRASAVQAKFESTRLLNDFMDVLLQNPHFNDLMIRGRISLDSVSPQEYLQFSNMSLKAFWFFSAGYFQFRHGSLAATDWFELRAVIHYWLRTPGSQDWWRTMGRSMFGDEFAAFIESEVAILAADPSGGATGGP